MALRARRSVHVAGTLLVCRCSPEENRRKQLNPHCEVEVHGDKHTTAKSAYPGLRNPERIFIGIGLPHAAGNNAYQRAINVRERSNKRLYKKQFVNAKAS